MVNAAGKNAVIAHIFLNTQKEAPLYKIMIQDTLKDRKPDQKPRFFLHDEMVEWLRNNLTINTVFTPMYESDPQLCNKLAVPHLIKSFYIKTDIKIGDEPIMSDYKPGVNLDEWITSLRCITNVVDTCMQKIMHLQAENAELRKRIELIETPLPV